MSFIAPAESNDLKEFMLALTEEAVSNILQGFGRAVLNPTEWMPAMSAMSDAMGAGSCSMELADNKTGSAVIYCTYPLDTKIVQLYEERVFHINPRVVRAKAAPVGMMLNDNILTKPDDPNMGEFLDWLGHTPNQYIQGAKLLHEADHEIYFGSYFTKAHGPPEPWHEDAHRLITPHLINFVSIGRVLSQNKLTNQHFAMDAFEGERPFALLDRAGRIVECSLGFEAALRSSDVLGVRDNRLVAVHAQHRSPVEKFMQSVLGERRFLDPPFPIRLSTPIRPKGIILRALPMAPNEDIFDVFRPVALITLIDLDHSFQLKRDELVELFDLTRRESDVALLVGRGQTVEWVARNLSLSEYTVRQHLKAIFGKMGISRQAELVAIFAKLS